MHHVDSEHHKGCDLTMADSQVVALPLQQETLDCVSEVLEADEGTNVAEQSCDRHLEQFISHLLQYGVFLSSAIVLVGGILYLIRYGTEPADYRFFQSEPFLLRSPKGVMKVVLSGHCLGFIQFGLLLLIATPVTRVAFSFLAFLKRRDLTYVFLTFLVLAGLIYSFIGAYA